MKNTLRRKQIKDAEVIKSIKYPAGFHIENADFTDRRIEGCDFSLIGPKLTGYEPVININIESTTGYEPVILDFK